MLGETSSGCLSLFPAAEAGGFADETGVKLNVTSFSDDEDMLEWLETVGGVRGEESDIALRGVDERLVKKSSATRLCIGDKAGVGIDTASPPEDFFGIPQMSHTLAEIAFEVLQA